jgi:hypothetical protein
MRYFWLLFDVPEAGSKLLLPPIVRCILPFFFSGLVLRVCWSVTAKCWSVLNTI